MKINNNGFTLVELIVVIAIIAILIVIVVPRYNIYTEKIKEQVCETNCYQLDTIYNAYLIIENIEHEENIFRQYLQQYGEDICPAGGSISYDDERIKCNIHDENKEDDGQVPYI